MTKCECHGWTPEGFTQIFLNVLNSVKIILPCGWLIKTGKSLFYQKPGSSDIYSEEACSTNWAFYLSQTQKHQLIE